MSTNSHVSRRKTALLAIVFLIPAIILFMMWSSIGLRYDGLNEAEKMDMYLKYFPAGIRNINIINVISIICCLVAMVLASRSFKKHLLSLRVVMLLTVLIAIIILLFDISQLI